MQRSHAFTPYRLALLAGTLLYTVGFSVWFVISGDGEFIWYLLQFFIFILIACAVLWHVPDFPNPLLTLLVFVGGMHMAGGGVPVGDTILYGVRLFTFYDGGQPDLYILKYDQLVHLLGFGVAALAFRYFLMRSAPSLRALPRAFFAILAAVGLSVVNEISELIAILLFERTNVGGYYNLILDLAFNFIGAILAIAIVETVERLKKRP
ncbi:hypothetical protein A2841_01320 [Candidatus Kaiserbacteria bacterium RIFCSPHIGHO2_01_FULL_48_10]|uniref:DUF2238 domain-containing protein n=1 Tax=Candidatus Kaiserbacteria bacterium RIFCSPHIGHO2_01_FULL_48_10 TaxID=1798476 RepID=A0A1F6C4P2_9BACT|nr:MAG: hypothetical protein A2841_01320 [Candidatus Kaiserbacteria bacterium RIFCSPHIGHO2_01_FULL_48_10]